MTTMRDVARKAGVSVKTVSRVYRGEPHVNEETAAAVRRAMAALGYQPHSLARAFRTGAPDPVTLLLPSLAAPAQAAFASGVHAALREAGRPTLLALDPPAIPPTCAGAIAWSDGGPRAPISAGTSAAADTMAPAPPLVLAGCGPVPYADTVAFDQREVAHEAARGLLAAGYRHPVLVGDSSGIRLTRERLAGARAALREAGVGPDPLLTVLEATPDRLRDVLSLTLRAKAGVAGLLLLSPALLPVVVAHLREAGRTDIVLALCDPTAGLDLVANPCKPAWPDARELGHAASALLLDRIAGRLPAQPVHRTCGLGGTREPAK